MNEEIRADVTRFRSMLQHISATYKSIDNTSIEDYVASIETLLTDRSAIESHFTPIACGAFKECYQLNRDFVIKFASYNNETDIEEALLDEAAEAGVAEIFLPTWYCHLNSKGPDLLMLDDEDSSRYYYDEEAHTYVENEDWTSQYADYIIIQPRIAYTVESQSYIHIPRNAMDYDKAPIIDTEGNKVDFRTAYNFYVSSQTWLQDVMNTYGIEFFNRLADFIRENDVHDLHTGNIGYYVRKDGKLAPVIFDCLSCCY